MSYPCCALLIGCWWTTSRSWRPSSTPPRWGACARYVITHYDTSHLQASQHLRSIITRFTRNDLYILEDMCISKIGAESPVLPLLMLYLRVTFSRAIGALRRCAVVCRSLGSCSVGRVACTSPHCTSLVMTHDDTPHHENQAHTKRSHHTGAHHYSQLPAFFLNNLCLRLIA